MILSKRRQFHSERKIKEQKEKDSEDKKQEKERRKKKIFEYFSQNIYEIRYWKVSLVIYLINKEAWHNNSRKASEFLSATNYCRKIVTKYILCTKLYIKILYWGLFSQSWNTTFNFFFKRKCIKRNK